MIMPEFLKYILESVLFITVRQEYQSVYMDSFDSFQNHRLNLLINSSKAWIVNFNNGNDNNNDISNNNYVRCVR